MKKPDVSSLATWFFHWAFDTDLSHFVMHSALFAGLGPAAKELLAARPRWQAVLLALTGVACVAFGQEAFQALSAGNLHLGGTLLDLSVDLISGGIGIALAEALLVRRHRADWTICRVSLPLERQ